MVLKKNQPGYVEAKDKNNKTYWKKNKEGSKASSLDSKVSSLKGAVSDFEQDDDLFETPEKKYDRLRDDYNLLLITGWNGINEYAEKNGLDPDKVSAEREKQKEEFVEEFKETLPDINDIQAEYKSYRKLNGDIADTIEPKGDKWGTINESISCGNGMRFVSCSGHGGFLLSPAREHSIPLALRAHSEYSDFLSGRAYEEDNEFNIIGIYHTKESLKAVNKNYANSMSLEEHRDRFIKNTVDYNAERMMRAMCEEYPPREEVVSSGYRLQGSSKPYYINKPVK